MKRHFFFLLGGIGITYQACGCRHIARRNVPWKPVIASSHGSFTAFRWKNTAQVTTDCVRIPYWAPTTAKERALLVPASHVEWLVARQQSNGQAKRGRHVRRAGFRRASAQRLRSALSTFPFEVEHHASHPVCTVPLHRTFLRSQLSYLDMAVRYPLARGTCEARKSTSQPHKWRPLCISGQMGVERTGTVSSTVVKDFGPLSTLFRVQHRGCSDRPTGIIRWC